MPRFTDTQEITYLDVHEYLPLQTNHATAGVLTIEAWDGVSWNLADTIATTGITPYFVKGLVLRFTPANGMTYVIPRSK